MRFGFVAITADVFTSLSKTSRDTNTWNWTLLYRAQAPETKLAPDGIT